jgi:hypothetical protein
MLMKLKLQGPSLVWPPSKALEGPLTVPYKCPEILLAHIRKTPVRGIPKFDNSPKNLDDITKNELSN